MPTGYTSHIEDGTITDLKGFAEKCARAFGACIEMRDSDSTKEIPEEFAVSNYHLIELEKDTQILQDFLAKSNEELLEMFNTDVKLEIAGVEVSIIKKVEVSQRYSKILKEVKEWVPPTSEHIGLKEFMIQQIETSVPYDCDTKYDSGKLEELKNLTYKDWYTRKIANLNWQVNYHEDGYKSEVEKVASRNKWIKQLRDSLESK